MQEVNDNKNTRTHYVSKDLVILIPTKDRPKEVGRLLQSIKELDCEVGRVIVVASGQDISDVVIEFSKILPVEYYSSESGQIKQRNKGIIAKILLAAAVCCSQQLLVRLRHIF